MYSKLCRDVFESWYADKPDCPSIERHKGAYKLMQAHQAWIAWEAAWDAKPKSVPLSTQAALECTIEHLDGIHAGKIVVDIDVFNTLYEAARESLE